MCVDINSNKKKKLKKKKKKIGFVTAAAEKLISLSRARTFSSHHFHFLFT